MNINLSLEDVAKLYFPTETIKTAEMIESAYNRFINPYIGQKKIR